MDIPFDQVGNLRIDPSVFEKLLTLSPCVLRIGVLGGGCSGFQYDIRLDEVSEDDFVFKQGLNQICVDPVSNPFLSGAVLVFQKDLTGSRFVVNNPNVSSSCGCGLSFSI